MDGNDTAYNAGQASKVELAEILLPSKAIAPDVQFWTSEDPGLGFRMEQIYPADNPQVVVLSGHGMRMRMRLDTAADATSSPGSIIRLLCKDPDTAFGGQRAFTSPSGTLVTIADADPTAGVPPPPPPQRITTQHAFHARRLRDNAPWIIGRAGMHYRDLIPGRLGGAIIASHIRIPDAGPVPDSVHFHDVRFQLIHCLHGWVRLVYEDQGPAFILAAGDCVVQPPRIRHRVLEASAGLEVVEIGVPAEHLTTVDHDMALPTRGERPDREWDGQRFLRSRAAEAVWRPWRVPGFEARDAGVGVGTKGVAAVQVARPLKAEGLRQGVVTSHTSDILFNFVLTGTCTLHGDGQGSYALAEGDAYVLPPEFKTCLKDCSDNLTLLEVSLPADFATTIHLDTECA
ncbi:unnamed protein product [Discula destructiva]